MYLYEVSILEKLYCCLEISQYSIVVECFKYSYDIVLKYALNLINFGYI